MTEEYTPTTSEVRFMWEDMAHCNGHDDGNASFDRWLAAHDREVAAKALVITNNDIDPHTASKRIVEAGNWIGDGYWSLGDLNNLLVGIAEQRYGEQK